MYPVLVALPYADILDIWEYGAKNVAYLKQQCQQLDPEWQQWIDKLCELHPEIYGEIDFQQQLQDKITVIQGSIFNLPQDTYESISMHSVIESLTKSSREFKKGLKRCVAAGKSGSSLIAT